MDPSAAGPALDPGAVVAGYVVEGLAGAGGMGVVYRAADTELGRQVALKLIAPARAGDPRFRELFVRESLVAAGLEHPNVIPIYRAGEDAGRLYIAMRFVEGASLQDLIAGRGRVPPGRAARIVARVADALDAAHARGLVHRDVKPANVLIADPDGEEHVYLTDFGLTAGMSVAREGGDGGWAGTLAYVAPEQIRGGPIDARTDVYALGCVLFHALAGRPPFPTDDEAAALEAHLTQAPPRLADVAPGLPPAMDDVVRRAMAKRPEDRFASAGELGRAALAARYDVAVLSAEGDAAAAREIAARLQEAGLQPLLPEAPGGRGAAEGVGASSACAVLVGREGLGDWAREGLAAAKEIGGRDRAFRKVLVLLPGGPDPVDPSLAFLATNPWIDLRAGIADPHGLDDLVRVLRGAEVGAGLVQAPADACPYRGLEAFREEDADLYFGREEDVARLVERLRATRFLAVLGPSGSGKSSLVAAGLIPAVRRGALPGGEAWRVVHMAPGARPLAALAAQLRHLPGSGSPGVADLAADERALDLAVARAMDGHRDEERVLLVVDQLEEIFTLCQDAGERAAFLGNLMYAASIPGGRTVVVVAMRADFYGRLAEHPELRATVAAQQALLGPLDARGLRRAVEQPARRAGLELEPGLTRRILTDVADRPGTLPLMEHLLVEVWQRRRGRTLTLEAYAASGGVEGALARRANAIYGGMSPERQAVARRVLLRLTQPGEGTEDTRRRAERRELMTRAGEEAEVDAVVGALAEARLLTTGTDEATGEPVVEVTHEALIRGWPELRGWINDDREQLRLHRRLSDAAADWDAGGRDDGQLYRGAPLAVWEGRDEADLNELERGFLSASRDRIDRERASRRKRTRILIGSLAGVAAVIAGIAVFAFVQRNEAADQRDVATSRQLASSALLQLPSDPELSLLLAQRAFGVDGTPEAEEVLRQATYSSQIRAASRTDADVRAAVPLLDGERIVSAGDAGVLRLWSPESGRETVVDAGQGEVYDVAVASDERIASAGADGTIALWTAGGAAIRKLQGHEGAVDDVAFAPSGRALVSTGEDGVVRLWNLPSGRSRPVGRHSGGAWTVAFAPDGRFVTGGEDGRVRLWSADGARRGVLTASNEEAVFGVAFSSDGRRVAAATGNLVAKVWSLSDPAAPPVAVRASQDNGVLGVAFEPGGSRFATAGVDGTVRVWSPSGTPLAVMRGHEQQVRSVAFTPDRRGIVSAGEDGTVRVWDWAHGLPSSALAVRAELPEDGATTFVGDREVAVVGLDGSLAAWRLGRRALEPRAPGGAIPDGFIYAAAVDSSGARYAISRADAVVEVRRVPADGSPLRLRAGIGISALDFSDDGRFLAGADADGAVRVWHLGDGSETVLTGHEGSVWAVDLSADGMTAVSGGEDGTVRVWDVRSGAQRAVLTGHEGDVNDVALSPDGAAIVSAGSDRTVRVWDVASGQGFALQGHEGSVASAEFSDDGTLVLSASEDGVRVWDWARRTAVLALASAARDTVKAHLSPGGDRIVVETTADRLETYSCETCGPIGSVERLAAERVTRELSAAEREVFNVTDGS